MNLLQSFILTFLMHELKSCVLVNVIFLKMSFYYYNSLVKTKGNYYLVIKSDFEPLFIVLSM